MLIRPFVDPKIQNTVYENWRVISKHVYIRNCITALFFPFVEFLYNSNHVISPFFCSHPLSVIHAVNLDLLKYMYFMYAVYTIHATAAPGFPEDKFKI